MMFWEIIATVFAGFLLAGLVLPIRLFFKKVPKWIVPAAAGLGMIGFQVYSEYTWADNTIAKLPDSTIVVAKVPSSTWFRPWSYVAPQTFQFVALDTESITSNPSNPKIKQANLYFFERRNIAYPLGISVDCQQPKLQFNDVTNTQIIQVICK